jgi:hypothetical protein
VVILVSISLYIPAAHAETLQSNNYKFSEPTLGSGSLSQSSSASYVGQSALGDLSVGGTSSQNFQINTGSKTSPDPVLSVAVTNWQATFDTFSASTAATASATFAVVNYSSYGYAVQIAGDPPTLNGHTITPLSTNTTSQTGIEQFGINMVANSSPSAVGANPNNGDFGFGQIGEGVGSPNYANYSTPNEYRYVPGETIASAPKSSGKTIYTISYLVNVSGITPAGKYLSNQTLIVTGTY